MAAAKKTAAPKAVILNIKEAGIKLTKAEQKILDAYKSGKTLMADGKASIDMIEPQVLDLVKGLREKLQEKIGTSVKSYKLDIFTVSFADKFAGFDLVSFKIAQEQLKAHLDADQFKALSKFLVPTVSMTLSKDCSTPKGLKEKYAAIDAAIEEKLADESLQADPKAMAKAVREAVIDSLFVTAKTVDVESGLDEHLQTLPADKRAAVLEIIKQNKTTIK